MNRHETARHLQRCRAPCEEGDLLTLLIRPALASAPAVVAIVLAAWPATPIRAIEAAGAAERLPTRHLSSGDVPPSPIVQRFLALPNTAPDSYRALRELFASNDHFNSSAWMEVWTQADRANGFRYEIVAEGGSPYIRTHVLRAALETERRTWSAGTPRIGFTPQNYLFEDRREERNGLARVSLKPRRKDALLVDGSILIKPDDGDLVRVEGRLAKSPSPWTRHVDIVRSYQRIAGVRVPVSVESVATLLLAGRSTFRMIYQYESVNGQHVGDPQPRPTAAVH